MGNFFNHVDDYCYLPFPWLISLQSTDIPGWIHTIVSWCHHRLCHSLIVQPWGRRFTHYFSDATDSPLHTVYPKKYAHGFVVLCFVVVMQSFIMNSHEVFIHIHQGCFAGTGAIVRLPQCQWSKADGYGKISQCITTTKHSKAKTVCIFLGIYCSLQFVYSWGLRAVQGTVAVSVTSEK